VEKPAILVKARQLSWNSPIMSLPFAGIYQERQEEKNILDNADIRNLENGGPGIAVDGDNELRSPHPRQVLQGAGNSAGDIEAGRHGLAGLPNLEAGGKPACITYRPGCANGGTGKKRCQIVDKGQIFPLPDTPPGRHHYLRRGKLRILLRSRQKTKVPARRRHFLNGNDFRFRRH